MKFPSGGKIGKKIASGAARHLGEDRHHVGVAFLHRGIDGDRPTELFEGIGERRGQTVGVRVAVVDGGSRGDPLLDHELRRSPTLEQVVVGGPVVAGEVVLRCMPARSEVRGRDVLDGEIIT